MLSLPGQQTGGPKLAASADAEVLRQIAQHAIHLRKVCAVDQVTANALLTNLADVHHLFEVKGQRRGCHTS